MAHRIDEKECLKCGVCVDKCPQSAIIDVVTENEGLVIHNTRVDPEKCNDCGVCEAAGDDGYFCPAKAFVQK